MYEMVKGGLCVARIGRYDRLIADHVIIFRTYTVPVCDQLIVSANYVARYVVIMSLRHVLSLKYMNKYEHMNKWSSQHIAS